MIGEFIALASGGILGVFLRHGVCLASNVLFGCHFPYGILCVNAFGGLLIGGIFELFAKGIISETIRIFLIPGLLGAFTTFSAYSLDTVNLLLAGRVGAGVFNIVLNNVLSLAFVYVGLFLVRCFLIGWRW